MFEFNIQKNQNNYCNYFQYITKKAVRELYK